MIVLIALHGWGDPRKVLALFDVAIVWSAYIVWWVRKLFRMLKRDSRHGFPVLPTERKEKSAG
jgi:hypothetical protein